MLLSHTLNVKCISIFLLALLRFLVYVVTVAVKSTAGCMCLCTSLWTIAEYFVVAILLYRNRSGTWHCSFVVFFLTHVFPFQCARQCHNLHSCFNSGHADRRSVLFFFLVSVFVYMCVWTCVSVCLFVCTSHFLAIAYFFCIQSLPFVVEWASVGESLFLSCLYYYNYSYCFDSK